MIRSGSELDPYFPITINNKQQSKLYQQLNM